MVEIIWSKLAEGQFERAAKYIQSEQGIFYATIVVNKIIESVDTSGRIPKNGNN